MPAFVLKIDDLSSFRFTTASPNASIQLARTMSMLSRGTNELARRGTWTCLMCPGSSSTTLTTIKQRSSPQRHERKHSSSKASSSSKEVSGSIAAPTDSASKGVSQEVKAASAEVPTASEKPPSLRASKRKPKDHIRDPGFKADYATQMNLPSVPSTQNLHPLNVHLASFFSTYRPLSISKAIPPPTSIAAFSSVFEAKPPSNSPQSDVIYTLASAVDHLENPATYQQHQQENDVPEEIDLEAAVTHSSSSNAQSPHNLDLPAKNFHINLQDLAKKFRPYTPPPPPVPLGALQEVAGKTSKADRTPRSTERKSYKTTLTIYESTHANGQRSYETHSSPLVIDESPSEHNKHLPSAHPRGQPFLARMRERQIKYEERIDERLGDDGVWQFISVKRQRKMKMKKHKYKKLMKRTKNLRRRLDRL